MLQNYLNISLLRALSLRRRLTLRVSPAGAYIRVQGDKALPYGIRSQARRFSSCSSRARRRTRGPPHASEHYSRNRPPSTSAPAQDQHHHIAWLGAGPAEKSGRWAQGVAAFLCPRNLPSALSCTHAQSPAACFVWSLQNPNRLPRSPHETGGAGCARNAATLPISRPAGPRACERGSSCKSSSPVPPLTPPPCLDNPSPSRLDSPSIPSPTSSDVRIRMGIRQTPRAVP